MNRMCKVVLLTFAWLLWSPAFAADLSGVWKNDELPAWMEIQFDSDTGTGTVRRNDEKPEAVGRVLLKDVVADGSAADSWRGQIFAARLGEYKDAEISLPQPDKMEIKVKVGFMSKTVTWTRAAAVPQQ